VRRSRLADLDCDAAETAYPGEADALQALAYQALRAFEGVQAAIERAPVALAA
jgi:hypothetical protein